MLSKNKIYEGDCFEIMQQIDDKSIDMILCDLPYGTTVCKWDTVIPPDKLWNEYKRIRKDNAPVLLFGIEPFSSTLRMSNIKEYRYDWYWHKSMCSNFLCAKKQPFFKVETISVFYKKSPTYNPHMREGKKNRYRGLDKKQYGNQQHIHMIRRAYFNADGLYYPDNVLDFKNGNNKNVHQTQKPLSLCEYLVSTYTNEGDLVLDNCCGSGTTCLASKNLNRNFIGIEKEHEYIEICNQRLKNGA